MSKSVRVIGLSLLAVSIAQAGPRFIDLGTLYGGGGDSWAIGVSADGLVVVGASYSPPPGRYEAFRWTEAGGMEALGFLEPAPDQVSNAWGAKADGSVVVGAGSGGAFRWENDAMMPLEPLVPGWGGEAAGVSADGSVIVGESGERADSLWRPIRWIDGVPEELLGLPPYDRGWATAVSADGTAVAVRVWAPGSGSYCWRSSAVTMLHLLLPSSHSGVEDISANGLVAVGLAQYDLIDGYSEPVRWDTLTGDVTPLGLLPGKTKGWANGVSADGAVVVGYCYSVLEPPADYQPFIWDAVHGMRDLEEVLVQAGLGLQISGWHLGRATAISDDGKVIVGTGLTPGGLRHAWLADLHWRPPNDDCENAQPVGWGPTPPFTAPRIVTGTLVDATIDGSSTCSYPHGPDVWYSLEAPADGHLFLHACGTSALPDGVDSLVLSVHDGCPGGSANTIWCANECAGPVCAGDLPCIYPQHLPVTAGQTFIIRVAQNAGDAPGNFELTIRFLPDNDVCDDAIFVDVPSQTPGMTSAATFDDTPPCDQVHQTGPGVWYKVIGTGRDIVANTFSGTDFDTKLSVFCSGCVGMECITANDDYHFPDVVESSVSWCSGLGVVYHILVHGKDDDTGNLVLDIFDGGSCTPTPNCDPPNDACEDALLLTSGGSIEIIGDNTSSTTDGSATCQPSNGDVWYSYTVACDSQVQIDTCQPEIGSLPETVLSVHDACGGAELACDFDPSPACLGRASVTVSATPGTELLIRVADAGASQEDEGTFPLRIVETPYQLSLSLPGGALPDAVQGQYYSTIVPISGGCPPRAVQASDMPTGLRFRYQALYGTPEVSGDFVLNMTVDDDGSPVDIGWMSLRILPSNDDCGAAIPITEGGYPFGNIGATTDGPDEPFGCNFSGYTHVESDIWFCYTSSCEGEATIDLCNSGYDTKVAVYEDCRCGAGMGPLLACDDDGCGGGQSTVTFDVHEGSEYLIRIGGYQGAQGSGLLMVTCQNKPVCCFPGGACENLWPDECLAQGGVPHDSYAPCDTVECPPETEACCFIDGSCEDLSVDDCMQQWGIPLGPGTNCAITSCQAPEACCFEDHSCQDLDPVACSTQGGYRQGVGTTCATEDCLGPFIAEPGWTLIRSISFTQPWAARYNPVDGLIYVGRRASSGGLYVVDNQGYATMLASASNPAALVIDANDGDIFLSEDYGGSIYRTAFGATGRETWVSGFHTGDDDPIGMAIAPADYIGTVVAPGEALVVDRGYDYQGRDQVWAWSPQTAQGELVVHGDDGTLNDALDITINSSDVYLVDARGTSDGILYLLSAGGALTPLATSESLADPCAIAFDPLTDDLYVVEAAADRLVRVDPTTGTVSDVFTGFAGISWASVDVTPDGLRMVLSDYTVNTIYVFARCDASVGAAPDCNGNGQADFCDINLGESLDCNNTRIPDECEGIGAGDYDADGDVDLDDFADFASCANGPGALPVHPAAECIQACLMAFDLDSDLDVDLHDFAAFQRAFGGD